MSDINSVVLVGRVVRDAELRYTGGGMPICRFSLAVNRSRKEGDSWTDEPNFFDIVLFGRLGEAVGKYLVKGQQVAVQGELRQNRWEQDGQRRSKVEIVASNIRLMGGRGQASSSNTSSYSDIGSDMNDDFVDNLPEEDIPF
ncbi:single-stranded DNA-binding protein [Spirochaetia bacterium 38H-sp]|uniref:Single-stranded DNA-binding protein n=1 Tax=Rarispira pelagica TaxID=3141764 RepID=A0ABU9UC01_9SPIR